MTNSPEKKPLVPTEYKVMFSMLVSCFVLWGLLNNMTDNLVPAFSKIFMMSSVNSSLVQFFFYGAYACLAIPASLVIKKWSFRHGLLLGLSFYMIGALGYIPAAILQEYDIFLVSIFILAGGLSILETTCNPFVIALGDPETSILRINFAQAFNPIGSIVGIFLAKIIILANLNPATYDERMLMPHEQLASIRNVELIWVCVPYICLIAIAFTIWLYFFRSKSVMKDEGGDINFIASIKELIVIPKYVFGVVAQCFNIGMQICVWTWTIKYMMTLDSTLNEAVAANTFLYSIFCFVACRWICTFLMRYMNAALLMTIVTFIGILVSLGTIYIHTTIIAQCCLCAISGCMSLLFPTIYGIALGGLSKEAVKLGAAGLIMAIGGAAILTPIQGYFIDNGTLSFLAPSYEGVEAAVRTSYFMAVMCFTVCCLYSFFNIKKRA